MSAQTKNKKMLFQAITEEKYTKFVKDESEKCRTLQIGKFLMVKLSFP